MNPTVFLTLCVLYTVLLAVLAEDIILTTMPTNLTINSMFTQHMLKYRRNYRLNSLRYQSSLKNFRNNVGRVVQKNNLKLGTAVYAVTKFADLSDDEFKKLLGFKLVIQPMSSATIPEVETITGTFDWRTYNAVSPVKDQGTCGSCWAYSVTGAIESQYHLKYGVMETFSEQQLVDCDTLNYGCDGGWPAHAMQAINQMGGLQTDASYPYVGRQQQCKFSASKASVNVANPLLLPTNETQILQYLYNNGPLTAAINAIDMLLYESGISHPTVQDCDPNDLNHAVLIVGYGTSPIPYWIIKNTWNTDWGEQGYYRIYRGDNSCGIASNVVAVVIE